MTLIYSVGPFQLWHNDPCNKPGCRDDSCGWFLRASHGKPEVLAAIKSRLDFDFDRVYKSYDDDDVGNKHKDPNAVPRRVYHTGLFCPNGDPNLSVYGIVLNLFQAGAWCYFHDKHRKDTRKAWKESRRFMQSNLFDILFFAENPTDSLFGGITGMFRIACGEKWNRDEALDRYAACIYGWILRAERPWYRHPRWHVHHWSLNILPFWKYWWWDFRRSVKRPSRNDTRYGDCANTSP